MVSSPKFITEDKGIIMRSSTIWKQQVIVEDLEGTELPFRESYWLILASSLKWVAILSWLNEVQNNLGNSEEVANYQL